MTKNFEFLKDITDEDYVKICDGRKNPDDNLYQDFCRIEKANEDVSSDGRVTILLERTAAERIAKLIQYKLTGNSEGSLGSILSNMKDPNHPLGKQMALKFSDAKKVQDYLEQIRWEGNNAVHIHRDHSYLDKEIAIYMMALLHEIMIISFVGMDIVENVPEYITTGS